MMRERGHISSKLWGSWRSRTFSWRLCWVQWMIRVLRRLRRGYLRLLRWRLRHQRSQIISSCRGFLRLIFKHQRFSSALRFRRFFIHWLPSSWKLWSFRSSKRSIKLKSLWGRWWHQWLILFWIRIRRHIQLIQHCRFRRVRLIQCWRHLWIRSRR